MKFILHSILKKSNSSNRIPHPFVGNENNIILLLQVSCCIKCIQIQFYQTNQVYLLYTIMIITVIIVITIILLLRLTNRFELFNDVSIINSISKTV